MAAAALSPAAFAIDPDKRFHDYVKDVWGTDQGLPQMTIRAIAQDGEQFLWIGTYAGLARFDGVRFTTFTPATTPELPGLTIEELRRDNQGRLWIATYKGVAVYENRRFRRVPWLDATGKERSVAAHAIAETGDGDILIGGMQGVFAVTGERLNVVPALQDLAAYSLLPQDNSLLIGSVGTVYRFDGDALTAMPLPAGGESAVVNQLIAAQGALWASTSRGLFRHDGREWQLFTRGASETDFLAVQPVEALHEDSDGNLWVATQQGLGRIRDHAWHEYLHNSDPIAHRDTRVIYEDHEGSLWLGSNTQGLMRLWNGWMRRYGERHGLRNPAVWSLARGREGQLWTGTESGVMTFDGRRFNNAVSEDALSHPSVHTLLDDGERLWLGTYDGVVWHEHGRTFTPDVLAPLSALRINGIVEDRHGTVWIAADGGLFRFAGGTLFSYGEAQGLTMKRIRFIHPATSGRVYAGTHSGLLEIQGDRVRPVGPAQGLRANIDITAIAELRDGSIVVGTLEEEFFLHTDGRWFEFAAASGLPRNIASFIAEDSNGYLWVAGIRGLYRVAVNELHRYRRGEIPAVNAELILNARGADGSQKARCCSGVGNAMGFLENDVLWLPTPEGVIAVDTRRIARNPVPPPVAIERLRFDDQWHVWLPGASFALPAHARDIAVEFTLLSFQQPKNVRLQYRLNGYDAQWRELENLDYRNATYTNLPPGEYSFEVKGANNAGVWNEQIAAMPFTIAPRFHETLWFRLLLAAGALAVLFAAHRYQLRHLRAQRARLERAVQERTEELRVANRNLQEMTITDPLTGLRNRRYVQTQLPIDLAFYDRETLKPGANDHVMLLMLADIDHFKRINDTHGHDAGDRVLRQFSAVLQKLVRTGDYVVRWGGEEFLIVFRPMPLAMTTQIAERVRKCIEDNVFRLEGDVPLRITSSIGFVEYPLLSERRGRLRWEDMVTLADHALYYVKTHGRNGWAVLRPTPATAMETLVDDVRLRLDTLLAEGGVGIVFGRGNGTTD